MKSQVFHRSILFLSFCFLFTHIAFSTNGKDGTINAEFDSDKLDIGKSASLTITVKNMTNGSAGGKNGSGKYTITIPDNILNADGSEITERSHTNDLTEKGSAGNGTYEYGPYTTQTPGIYTFPLNVTSGTKAGSDPTVTFYPVAPVSQPATDIGLRGFKASWQAAAGAGTYTVTLTNGADTIEKKENVRELSYEFSELTPGTTYTYSVRSVVDIENPVGKLLSLSASAPIEVTTLRPVLSYDEFEDFPTTALGENSVTTLTVNGTNLLNDIHLKVEPEGVFGIDKTVIKASDENKTVNLTFSPQIAGKSEALLTISSEYALDLEIPLTATAALLTPKALEATEIGGSSFIANWEAAPFAESYRLTVLDYTETPLEDYNGLPVGNTTGFEVKNLLPKSSYSYYVTAENNEVQSAPSNVVKVSTIDGAVITYSKVSPFTVNVNEQQSKTIRISGTNLTDNINIELSDRNNFSIDKTTLESEGGTVLITYAPATVGLHTSTLSLRSTGAADIHIELQGRGLPLATTALPASGHTPDSFTANWEAAENAEDYLVSVMLDKDTVVDDRSSEGATSLLIDNLQPGKVYSYTVKVVKNGLASEASNAISAFTHSAPQPTAYAEQTSIRVKWNALPGATGYKAYLFEGESDTPMPEYDGVGTTDTTFTFSGLTIDHTYSYQIESLFEGQAYSSDKTAIKTSSHYGAQIRNSDFEAWDKPGTKEVEPSHWNSFMTNDGSFGSMARKQQVDTSLVLRPDTKGKLSAVIWSTNPIGSTIANGNLTTGRIVANSMTADNPGNHNVTLPDNDAFNAPFNERPDSLTVWVRFIPKTTGDKARVAATLHGNYAYQDPNNSPNIEKYAVAKAELNYEAANDNGWQRLTIPFVSTGNDVEPAYMLVSFTTNMKPGKGSNADSVYVDDMLMVYKPSVSVEKTNKSKYVPGEQITVSYTLKGTMSPYNLNAEPNIVYLELSDADGSFDHAQRIARLTTDYSGELTARLPDEMEVSSDYRVRIVTTNYPMTSAPGEPFTLRHMPPAPVAKKASEITAASFTANWEVVDGATGYIVSTAGKDYAVEEGTATSLEIKGLTPETEYTYVVKTVTDDLTSAPSNEISVKTAGGGSIIITGKSSFVNNINVEMKETLTLEAVGLIDKINISLLDNESGYFAIDTHELSVEGGTVGLAYHPLALGTHSAKLLVKSSFIDNQVLEISGTCIPKTVNTLPASSITPVSFTAQWEVSEEAEAYLLTVFDSRKEILPDYNLRNVGLAASFDISGLSSGADYSYSVVVSCQDMLSEPSDKTIVQTAPKPLIHEMETIAEFVLNVNETADTTLVVLSENLYNDSPVSATLSGSEAFTTAGNTIADNEITISYQPTEVGKDTAVLTFTTAYAEPVSITLTGMARPAATVALPASSSSYDSFVANWEASSTADSYLLTVKDDRNRTVDGYDQKNMGYAISAEVAGLKRLKNYTYYVEVLKTGITSLPSNTVEVRTVPGQSGLSQAEAGDIKLYPNPAKNHLLVTGLPENVAYTIIDTKGMSMMSGKAQGNKINIENLPANIYILKVAGVNLPFIKE